MQDYHYTQQKLSEVLSKDRTTIANLIRLLKLPTEVKKSLAHKEISMGHARCLLSIVDPQKLREAHRLVLIKGLSVRETEKLAKKLNQVKKKRETDKEALYLQSIQENLMQCLGTRVKLSKSGKKGKIVIEFYSPEELERIIERIKGIDGKTRF